MAEAKILLIDDDETLLDLLADHLRTLGYHASCANAGSLGMQMAADQQPDLVILDVMMPGMDGWEVCGRLRQVSQVPIIMLTAKGQEVDKLRGFRLGVDDYVTKPFSFAELGARVAAILARVPAAPAQTGIVRSGELAIDLDERRVTRAGGSVDLTRKEYDLLEAMARSFGRTVPLERLLEQVWGDAYTGELHHIKHYIWSLRKKIEDDPGKPVHILTERGFGYRLE